MRLRSKVFGAFAVLVVVEALLLAGADRAARSVNALEQRAAYEQNELEHLDRLRGEAAAFVVASSTVAADGSGAGTLARWDEARARLADASAAFAELESAEEGGGPADSTDVSVVAHLSAAVERLIERGTSVTRAAGAPAATDLYLSLVREELEGRLASSEARVLVGIQEDLDAVRLYRSRAMAQLLTGSWLGGALMMAVLVGGGAWIAHAIRRGTDALLEGASRVAAGEVEVRLAIESGDEFAIVARAMERMSAEVARHRREAESHAADLRQHVAELASARDIAVAASRAKSVFLANMSHELRTPLNAILGYADLAAEEIGTSPESSRQDLERISAAGNHLLSLISDILDLAKIEADRLDLEPVDVEPRRLLDELASTVRPLVHRNANRLVVRCDPDLPVVRCDANRVRQVLLNLIGNASKFTREGTIGLDLQLAQTALVIAVSDTGIGISPERQASIFDEFTQAEQTTRREYGGTGLGLAISRRLAERMGGTLEVSSRLGAGSTFTLRVPVTVAERRAA